GSFLRVLTSVWERVGGFDERFFMYGEHMALCTRARQMAFRPLFTPDASVMHHVGASSSDPGRQMAWILRGRVTAMRKHWTPMRRHVGVVLLLVGVGIRALASRAAGRDGHWLGAWRRRGDWIGGWPSDPPPLQAAAEVDECGPPSGPHPSQWRPTRERRPTGRPGGCLRP